MGYLNIRPQLRVLTVGVCRAQVGAMGVPYMVADVGGVSELVDLGAFSEAVLPEAGAARLAAQLQTVLERGTLPLLPLRPQARIRLI